MEVFILHILKLNIIAAIVILLVKLLAILLKGRVSARWKYFVWLLVTISLLIPIQFPVSRSLVNLQIRGQRIENSNEQLLSDRPGNQKNIWSVAQQESSHMQNKKTFEQKFYTVYETGKRMKTAVYIFLSIWLAIAALKLAGEFMAYSFSMKKLERMSLPVNDLISMQMYRETCEKKHIRRKPQLRQNAGITTPLLAGLFHTKLYLPSVGYSAEERKLIFCHELTHYCHKDLWYKLLLRICASVYWFNPFLLLMLKEADKDIENLCDTVVIQEVSKSEHRLYRQLLLRTVAMDKYIPYATAGLNDSGIVFKDRILYMLNIRKFRRGIIPGVLLAVLLEGTNLAFSVSAGTGDGVTAQERILNLKEKDSGLDNENTDSDDMVDMRKVSENQSTKIGESDSDAGFDNNGNTEENMNGNTEITEIAAKIPADKVEQKKELADQENGANDSDDGIFDEQLPANIPYTSGFDNASGVASIVADGEEDTESRVLQKNGDGTYSDINGFRYSYQGDGNWMDGEGNSYRTWNDEDYNSGIYLEQHELQGSNGNVNVKQTTNGDYYYRDADGIGYTDNGDGTWTDENGNNYTE